MAKQESRTVSVATCHSPAEAMMIQSVLSAHGISAVIPGAGAASFTAAATAFSSRVLVDEQDVEEAVALIAELRREPAEGEPGAPDEDEEGAQDTDERALEAAFAADEQRTLRRRMITASLCLSLILTLGTGHLLQRAWGRAMFLAGLEMIGLRYLFAGHRFGAVMFVAAIVLDAVGSATLAARRYPLTHRLPLPAAKLLPRPPRR
jgi:Putative prokaryotic signal transducing protein